MRIWVNLRFLLPDMILIREPTRIITREVLNIRGASVLPAFLPASNAPIELAELHSMAVDFPKTGESSRADLFVWIDN